MRIEKKGKDGQHIRRIQTLEDWHDLAPPASEVHWVEGRSAMEAARAWLERAGEPPAEVLKLFSRHADFDGVEFTHVEPEALLRFDERAGPRHADLSVMAEDRRGPIAVTVEAKADEPFDELVGVAFSNALETLLQNPRSGKVDRIVELAQSLFRPQAGDQQPVTSLRYQLLTATAGTLAHAVAMGANRAVLIVHEFITSKTSEQLLAQNHADLSRFVGVLVISVQFLTVRRASRHAGVRVQQPVSATVSTGHPGAYRRRSTRERRWTPGERSIWAGASCPRR